MVVRALSNKETGRKNSSRIVIRVVNSPTRKCGILHYSFTSFTCRVLIM